MIYEDAEYVKQLLDDLATHQKFLIEAKDFDLIQKILYDLNTLMSMEYNSKNIDQIYGFEKAQKYLAEILLQVHDGATNIFDEKEEVEYVN